MEYVVCPERGSRMTASEADAFLYFAAVAWLLGLTVGLVIRLLLPSR